MKAAHASRNISGNVWLDLGKVLMAETEMLEVFQPTGRAEVTGNLARVLFQGLGRNPSPYCRSLNGICRSILA